MSLVAIKAYTHPDGNRIDLQWVIPDGSGFDGVRIVRHTKKYPLHPDDGVVVNSGTVSTAIQDTDLPAEHAYYYSLFPYQGGPPVYEFDHANRVFAVATAPHDFAGYMLKLLPAVYHRYDKDTQLLARFLEICGGQFDQLYSLASFNRKLQNLQHTPGVLLPLLAEWVGWRTDFKRGIDEQREEIRNAPEIYKTVGLVPTVEATVKRISGWETRTKEFVHNIFSANEPERLNLWYLQRDNAGVWSADENLLSLDYAYDGRPSFSVDGHQVRRLFYHTRRKGRWEIWYKTSPSYRVRLNLIDELQVGIISEVLLTAINDQGLTLTQTATVNNISTNTWGISDGGESYIIETLADILQVYQVNAPITEMAASQPLVVNGAINKHPSAALHDDRLWLFWSSYEESSQHWNIQYRFHSDAVWSAIGPNQSDWAIDVADNPFAEVGVYAPERQRRYPVLTTDSSNRLWVFWLEQVAGVWQLRYNRRDAGIWGEPVTMPLDGGDDIRIGDEFSVLEAAGNIYVFWSRPAETSTPGQVRWQVAVRVKQNLNLDDLNWTAVHELPKAATDDHHDREAFAISNGGDVEVFWSSNREDSGWSVWRSTLTDINTDTWINTEQVSGNVYSQRTPMPVLADSAIWLLYRANRQVIYNSSVYRATETYDQRYSGCLTPNVRHQQHIALQAGFEDSEHYTYDTGSEGLRNDENRIARDTVGAFLENDTLNDEAINEGIERLRPVAEEFMPITDRVVFIPRRNLHTDYVYGYDIAATPYIGSSYVDEFTSVLNADALEAGTDFSDSLL